MIIDFHTHIFPEKMAAGTIAALEQKAGIKAATNGCLEGLLCSMQKAGITCSVIMPVVTSPKQFASINRFAASVNEQYTEATTEGVPHLISFGGIHPESEDYKGQLKELKAMGFQGIKLHPDYQGVCFDDIRYKRIVSYASELDMTIMVHAGIDIGLPEPVHCTPAMSARVWKDTRAPKLVLAHLGGFKQWDEVEELLVDSEVYMDIAFIQQYIQMEQLLRIVKKHGSDKILFATDSPWTNQKEAVDWLTKASLSEEEKSHIFYKNALNLLGITPL
ncbi:MAG: amidohydrolase family protein [Lachnospiraceae bacterium]|nr:amidohydrolase family protein [Lachnospiraceae bacterium]